MEEVKTECNVTFKQNNTNIDENPNVCEESFSDIPLIIYEPYTIEEYQFLDNPAVEDNHETFNMCKTEDKQYHCVVCNKYFGNKNALTFHFRLHAKKSYLCKVCHERFSNKIKLAAHSYSHTVATVPSVTEEKPYSCDACSSCFWSKTTMTNHYRSHAKGFPYICEKCKKCFATNLAINSHHCFQAEEKLFCNMCSMSYSQKRDLIAHYLIHSEVKLYVCYECKKSFSKKGYLENHISKHSNNKKPYSCKICNKGFSNNIGLKKHHRIHTKEKSFSCKVCNVSFSDQNNLSSHNCFITDEQSLVNKSSLDESDPIVHIDEIENPTSNAMYNTYFSFNNTNISH